MRERQVDTFGKEFGIWIWNTLDQRGLLTQRDVAVETERQDGDPDKEEGKDQLISESHSSHTFNQNQQDLDKHSSLLKQFYIQQRDEPCPRGAVTATPKASRS